MTTNNGLVTLYKANHSNGMEAKPPYRQPFQWNGSQTTKEIKTMNALQSAVINSGLTSYDVAVMNPEAPEIQTLNDRLIFAGLCGEQTGNALGDATKGMRNARQFNDNMDVFKTYCEAVVYSAMAKNSDFDPSAKHAKKLALEHVNKMHFTFRKEGNPLFLSEKLTWDKKEGGYNIEPFTPPEKKEKLTFIDVAPESPTVDAVDHAGKSANAADIIQKLEIQKEHMAKAIIPALQGKIEKRDGEIKALDYAVKAHRIAEAKAIDEVSALLNELEKLQSLALQFKANRISKTEYLKILLG